MSLDVHLTVPPTQPVEVYWRNITHNLIPMAEEAGLYEAMWQGSEAGFHKAWQLIAPLEAGLEKLLDTPDYYKRLNPDNGWGDYDGLVDFVREYLAACKEHPDADVRTCR